MTDTQGLAWTYTYTGSHLLYEVLDPAGNLVERTDYDAEGRAVYQENGAGVSLVLSSDEHETIFQVGRREHHVLFAAVRAPHRGTAVELAPADHRLDLLPVGDGGRRLDPGTLKPVRTLAVDPGSRAFGIVSDGLIVYIHQDEEGELVLKCVQY